MDPHSYLANSDINAIESLYQQYKSNPQSVDSSWQRFFEGFEFQRAEFAPLPGGEGLGGAVSSEVIKEFKVINLINGYRQRGHLFTETNPVRERRWH
jgi:2-oxoglutarate dehydrogenase E1 component